jgi:hypothetical protein
MMKKLLAALPLLLTFWSVDPALSNEADQYCFNPNWTSGLNQWVPCPSLTISGNSTGTTGAVVGTLAAAAGKTTYICGFSIDAVGTGAIGPITVAGLLGGSMIFQLTAAAGGAFRDKTFSPCIPAIAVNTAITVTTTADGSASAVDVNSWGYQL